MASNKFNVALLGSVTAAAMMLAGPVLADEVNDLRAQIEALSQKVQQIETQKAQPAPIPANVVTGGDFGGSYKLPGSNTSFKIGGYAKLDIIHDIDQADQSATGDVPIFDDDGTGRTTDQNTGVTQLFAGQSRIYFDSRTATEEAGTVRGYLEGHMFGGNLGIRHAFTSWGNWLAGQTWTTYRDLGSMAESIDFGGPVGDVGVTRQPMLRYTQKFGSNTLQLAIEDPAPATTGTEGDQRNKLPDFIVNLKNSGGWGHITAGAVIQYVNVAQQATANVAVATEDDPILWGLKLSGRFNKVGGYEDRNNLRWTINGGEGIGRYAGFNDLGSGQWDNVTGKFDASKVVQGYVAYQHHWNKKWRSNGILGAMWISNPGSAANTSTDTLNSVHANVIYDLTSKTMLGLEYSFIRGKSEAGLDGEISRVQAMVQHSF